MMNLKADMWDLKQESYPRFDPNDCEFEENIISACQNYGVSFAGKNILEIGCGTGRYTILLANSAAQIDALDFSKNMLAALRQDAQKQGVLEKINCICADFAEFSSNKKYDILFAAMTPALFNLEDYSKIANLADKFVYLGWGGKRESALMSEIFAAHGANLRVHNGSNRLKDWLAQNNISFKNEFFDTSWEHSLSLDKAIKDHAWHLKMHDVEPENDKIRAVLEKYIDDRGLITNKTEARLELIIW